MTLRSDFERVAGALDPAMVIVTAAAGERRSGCLVGFHTQVSIDPPRMLVCVSKQNRTHEVAEAAPVLAVHVVPGEQKQLAELFGGATGDDVDKFERCEWTEGPEGIPLLDECPLRFAGWVLSREDLGDHTGFVLEPIGAGDEEGAVAEEGAVDEEGAGAAGAGDEEGAVAAGASANAGGADAGSREPLRLNDAEEIDPGHEA